MGLDERAQDVRGAAAGVPRLDMAGIGMPARSTLAARRDASGHGIMW